jgi:hypothetical protein
MKYFYPHEAGSGLLKRLAFIMLNGEQYLLFITKRTAGLISKLLIGQSRRKKLK